MKNPKIAILDSYAIHKGDLDWSPLKKISDDIIYYGNTPTDLLAERIGDSEMIIMNSGPKLSRSVLEKCPHLRYVGLTATGYDSIDTSACKERGIVVCNVPGYSTEGVAQQLFALLLTLATQMQSYVQIPKDGRWLSRFDEDKLPPRMFELYGKTIGIIGYGSIGSAVARIASGFNMRVLCHTRSKKTAPDYVNFTDKNTLLCESDIVTLHIPSNSDTKGLVDRGFLSMMKKDAVLCNVSRGAILDENAVADALACGRLSGFVADVLATEPYPEKSPLLKAPNTVITPHVAWGTKEALATLSKVCCENVFAFLDNKPQNDVTGSVS